MKEGSGSEGQWYGRQGSAHAGLLGHGNQFGFSPEKSSGRGRNLSGNEGGGMTQSAS